MSPFTICTIGAGLLAVAACGSVFKNSERAVEIVHFEVGSALREMVSLRLYEKHLSAQVREGEPYVATIGSPHVLRIRLGSEAIELHPGGYNSVTYFIAGFRRAVSGERSKPDYSRIGEISTDTGSRLLTRRNVTDLASRLCAVAEKGLRSKSSLDPDKVIDSLASSNGAGASLGQFSGGDVCVVENLDATFILRINWPHKSIIEEGEEAFRLNVSFGQALKMGGGVQV